MIVVDANIIAYALIEGEKTAMTLRARERDPGWVVPALWRHEFLNVLSTLVRNKMLTMRQALEVWEGAVRVFKGSEYPVDMAVSLELSVGHRISAYDAQYVALAKSLGVMCLTEDRALVSRFPGLAVTAAQFVGRSR
ncbi:MAG TPA: type II toxin-antitoxin system VapC family toxin [Spirochaetota bacterium]|nr:type II toxin-antitoxin system VapC family toxin [Spirochaetota bacterium]HNT11859.1 type II toxin-antitoxin system VapC family toxin [Spirochaetota bacterium]